MSQYLDDLVSERARAIEAGRELPWDPADLWQQGQRRRRTTRVAFGAAGAVASLVLVAGLVATAGLGHSGTPQPGASPAPSHAGPSATEPGSPAVRRAQAAVRAGASFYADPGAEATALVDAARVNQDIGNAPITVVLLPAAELNSGLSAPQLAAQITADEPRIVIVIAGHSMGGAVGRESRVSAAQANTIVQQALSDHAGSFTGANVQGALDEAIANLAARLSPGAPATPGQATIAATLAAASEAGTAGEHFSEEGSPVTVPDGRDGTLTAVLGVRNPTADGKGMGVFLWHGATFVGTATPTEATAVQGIRSAGEGIAVTYVRYAARDPLCCPTLGTVTVTYSWGGAAPVTDRALPSGVLQPTIIKTG